jgi:tetrahydromethanopterin S-methyltransferase subunit H
MIPQYTKNNLIFVVLIFSSLGIACVHASKPLAQSGLEGKVKNAMLENMEESQYESASCIDVKNECVVTYSFMEEEDASRIAHRVESILNDGQDEKINIITKKSVKHELICSFIFGIGMGLAAVFF